MATSEQTETMPWGFVRESIRAAVNTRWLTLTGGAVDFAFDQAGQLLLERPAAPELDGEADAGVNTGGPNVTPPGGRPWRAGP